MIPKIIHYCWLSSEPMPYNIQKCIKTWEKFLPDYEIKKWDFSKFDKNSSNWVREAFESKKYAFAADYLRCYALFNEGGIYLDSDVELLKPFDELLDLQYFIGEENEGRIEAAVIGATKGQQIFKEMLNYYDQRKFNNNGIFDLRPLPAILEEKINQLYTPAFISSKSEISNDNSRFYIFPFDYFSPKSHKSGKIKATNRTYCIHHFSGSWLTGWAKYRILITRLIGFQNMKKLSNLKQYIQSKI